MEEVVSCFSYKIMKVKLQLGAVLQDVVCQEKDIHTKKKKCLFLCLYFNSKICNALRLSPIISALHSPTYNFHEPNSIQQAPRLQLSKG